MPLRRARQSCGRYVDPYVPYCNTERMLAELRRLVDSVEFEEYGRILVSSCETSHSEITFEISVVSDSANESLTPSSWTITCQEYRRFRLAERAVTDLAVVDDHVVIAACDEKRYDLYFAGQPPNPFESVGRLTSAHRAAAQDWIPLSEFLNPALPPCDLFMTRGGLVAHAPHRIVQRYLQALREGGLDAYVTNERDPKRWDGARWVPESEILSAMIFGNNYVVAERFVASRGA